MALPGARLERVGTIFTRVRGLIRSGALAEVDRPVWYDVYEAFPPKQEPVLYRTIPDKEPVQILYLDDFIRAKYYDTYGNIDTINMTSKQPSISQRFIERYQQLEASGMAKDSVFKAVADSLKEEGVELVTLEERIQRKREAKEKELRERTRERSSPRTPENVVAQKKVNIDDLFALDDLDDSETTQQTTPSKTTKDT